MALDTYRDLLIYGRASLSDPNEAPVLLGAALNISMAAMYARLDVEPCAAEVEKYLGMLERRKRYEPIQYILGSWGFMSLDFYVNRHTMIPRAETEVLVEHVISEVMRFGNDNPGVVRLGNDNPGAVCFGNDNPDAVCLEKESPEGVRFGNGCPDARGIKILDICTGTGCVAISLAHFLPGAQVTGIDISDGAIETAKRNAEKNGVGDRAEFVLCDVFCDDSIMRLFDATGAVDIICSNPPYIPSGDIGGLMPDIRCYEPLAALDGGENGLDFYRRFAQSVFPRFMSKEGFAVIEVGAGQADLVGEIMIRKMPECSIYFIKDIHQIDRAVCCKKYF